jgi:hypothetical protein
VPLTVLAVKVKELAMPLAPVIAVHEVATVPPDATHTPLPFARNVPPALPDGEVNVTGTPATGSPALSVTNADSGELNAVPAAVI